jgi:hypothetical protein
MEIALASLRIYIISADVYQAKEAAVEYDQLFSLPMYTVALIGGVCESDIVPAGEGCRLTSNVPLPLDPAVFSMLVSLAVIGPEDGYVTVNRTAITSAFSDLAMRLGPGRGDTRRPHNAALPNLQSSVAAQSVL